MVMAMAMATLTGTGYKSANDSLLLSSIDLATFYDVSRLHLSHLEVQLSHAFFPRHWCGSPPPPTNHLYVKTCGIDEKLSKMAGNSVNYSLKSS